MRTLVRCVCPLTLCAISMAAQDTAMLREKTRDGRLAPLLANYGSLHSPVTTTSPEAQKFFNQGLTLVYAFNHPEALRSFREAARLDPRCAMAYWGQALALSPNINDSAIGPDREEQGWRAIQQALQHKAQASPKERVLIDALSRRFASPPPDSARRAALNDAYAQGMKIAYLRFRDDPDVSVLYADAVMNTRPWNYWQKNGKPAPGISDVRHAVEKTIRRYPDHPGARHIYIHLMEASDEVDIATASADRLGSLVPAAGHLVHMPGHIYIRVGRYEDAAQANRRAILADEDYITQCRAQGIYPAAYYPHNIHFLNAALIMEGRSNEALDSARKVASKHDHAAMLEPGFGFAHLLKTIPVLTMVRFGRWDEILNEPKPKTDMAFGQAMWHFARGYAFAATGRPSEAETELGLMKQNARLPELKQLKILDLNALSDIAAIAEAMLEGETAEKMGNIQKAITSYGRAITLEDALLYSEPPDWPLPPRQYLAAVYLRSGKAKLAEKTYREDLKRHRANGWSLMGLSLALRQQGKQAEADRTQQEFARAWTRADVALTGSRF